MTVIQYYKFVFTNDCFLIKGKRMIFSFIHNGFIPPSFCYNHSKPCSIDFKAHNSIFLIFQLHILIFYPNFISLNFFLHLNHLLFFDFPTLIFVYRLIDLKNFIAFSFPKFLVWLFLPHLFEHYIINLKNLLILIDNFLFLLDMHPFYAYIPLLHIVHYFYLFLFRKSIIFEVMLYRHLIYV